MADLFTPTTTKPVGEHPEIFTRLGWVEIEDAKALADARWCESTDIPCHGAFTAGLGFRCDGSGCEWPVATGQETVYAANAIAPHLDGLAIDVAQPVLVCYGDGYPALSLSWGTFVSCVVDQLWSEALVVDAVGGWACYVHHTEFFEFTRFDRDRVAFVHLIDRFLTSAGDAVKKFRCLVELADGSLHETPHASDASAHDVIEGVAGFFAGISGRRVERAELIGDVFPEPRPVERLTTPGFQG